MKYEEVVAERIIFDPNKIFEDEMHIIYIVFYQMIIS